MKRTIYIRLLEGIETWVPVLAYRKNDFIYEITENKFLDMDEDAASIWEFFPGDTVKCINDNGELRAIELIASIMPDRGIYDLVFNIVEHLGTLSPEESIKYKKEIIKLCAMPHTPFKQHPIIKKWLKENCR